MEVDLYTFRLKGNGCFGQGNVLGFVTTSVVLSGFLSSDLGELDKDNLFGLQKTFSLSFGKLCCTISHVHTPLGEL